MQDTPPHIEKKQLEIWLSKTTEQRFAIGFAQIEAGYNATLNRLRKNHPEKTERELIAELAKEWYAKDFSEEQMQEFMKRIVEWKN